MSTAFVARAGESKTEALLHAVKAGDYKTLETLLENGAQVNAANCGGMTPLMRAASGGQVDIVRLLLDYGADVNARKADGFTALAFAAFFGNREIVHLLLERGADVEARSRFGTSAEMWASARGFSEVADLLKHARIELPIQPLPESTSKSNLGCEYEVCPESTAIDSETTLEAAPIRRDLVAAENEIESIVWALDEPVGKGEKEERGKGEEDIASLSVSPFPVPLFPRSPFPPFTVPLSIFRLLTSGWVRLAGVTVVVMLICGVATYTVLKLITGQPKGAVVNSRDVPGASEPAKVPAVAGISPQGLQPAETESKTALNARSNSSKIASAADAPLKEVEPIRKSTLEEPKQKLKTSDKLAEKHRRSGGNARTGGADSPVKEMVSSPPSRSANSISALKASASDDNRARSVESRPAPLSLEASRRRTSTASTVRSVNAPASNRSTSLPTASGETKRKVIQWP